MQTGEVRMKFMGEWSLHPGTREHAIRRFLETGAPSPAGVKLLGRWHKADLTGGYTLVEAESAKDMADFSAQWSDVVTLSIHPVIEDGDAAEVWKQVAHVSLKHS
jgi:Protein of unknown function (DUF3303)